MRRVPHFLLLPALVLLLLSRPAAPGVSSVSDDLAAALESRRGDLSGKELKACEKALAKLAHPAMDESWAGELMCVSEAAKLVLGKLAYDAELLRLVDAAAADYAASAAGLLPSRARRQGR